MSSDENTAPARFDTYELEICTVCAHLIANGEYNDGTDAAEVSAAGIEATWGADAIHLSVTGGEPLFSTSPCDGCGNSDNGDRIKAVALIPK